MRYGIPLAIVGLVVGGRLEAQEAIPLPPPDPLPGQNGGAGLPPPAISAGALPPSVQGLGPVAPIGPPPGAYGPPAGYGSGPYGPPPPGYGPGPYGAPPPGFYGSPGYYGPPPGYGRPRLIAGDPVFDPRAWMNIESLVWWSKSQPLSIPVITTGPASQGDNAGGLGVPGTVSLNQPLNYGAGGGIRLNLGGWLTANHVWGLEGNVFSLGRQTAGFHASDRAGDGSFIINEPLAGAPFVTQVSAPGVETGSVLVRSCSELWGTEINGLYNLVRRDGLSFNLTGGFRYLQLQESVNILADSGLFVQTTYTDNLGNTLASAPPGSSVTVGDHFGVRNQFYGGQGGVKFQYVADRWSFLGTATLALGGTHEIINVNGFTDVNPLNGQTVHLTGGNYATLQTGTYSANRFAAVPAFQVNLGYQFTPFIRGIIGYNFLYISSVARPGNQIDNVYDGVVHPTIPFVNSSFWAQGINLGLQVSF
jgi:hypothetical protein